jgi:benzoyl-CoA reductase/2-hydroxyglutaryl-CoA dehydratase subunit BcrC/BadD/HgdB
MGEILRAYAASLGAGKTTGQAGPRILLTGSTLALGDYKVVELLEEAGASVVIEEFCEGVRDYWEPVRTDGDLLSRLADRYFTQKVPGAFFRGATEERFAFLRKLIADFHVDGVVWYSLLYRETYGIEAHLFQKEADKINLPMLTVASDYDPADTGALRTRIEAFIETLGRR